MSKEVEDRSAVLGKEERRVTSREERKGHVKSGGGWVIRMQGSAI